LQQRHVGVHELVVLEHAVGVVVSAVEELHVRSHNFAATHVEAHLEELARAQRLIAV